MLFARAKFISGELETAQHTINNCIRLDPTFAEAHLLSAQIAYHQVPQLPAPSAVGVWMVYGWGLG